MKTTKKAEKLLKQIAEIRNMERGKICRMKGRNNFNHQTWHAGRNIVRYVPREDIQDLEHAISGYTQFMTLAQQYADEIIRLSRREREKSSKIRKEKRKSKTNN